MGCRGRQNAPQAANTLGQQKTTGPINGLWLHGGALLFLIFEKSLEGGRGVSHVPKFRLQLADLKKCCLCLLPAMEKSEGHMLFGSDNKLPRLETRSHGIPRS
jgi:hypothetical protein